MISGWVLVVWLLTEPRTTQRQVATFTTYEECQQMALQLYTKRTPYQGACREFVVLPEIDPPVQQ